MHRSLSLGLLVTLALAAAPACNRSDATPPSRTVREATTTSSTSTTTLEQSYEVPEVIDEAYVNRVLAALKRITGDVVRNVHATREFTEEDLIPLRAVFNDPAFEAQARGYAGLVTFDDAEVKNPPGDNVVTVAELLVARANCVHARVVIDASQTLVNPPPPETAYLELRPKQPGADPHGINPTPWSIQHEDFTNEKRCDD